MGIESALSFKQAINGHWSQLPYETSSNRIVLLKWQPNALILKFCSKLTYIVKRVTLSEERAQTLKLRAVAFTKSETPILMHFPNCIYFSSLVKQVSIGWRRIFVCGCFRHKCPSLESDPHIYSSYKIFHNFTLFVCLKA